MDIDRPQSLVQKFFGNTARNYDKVVSYATFGNDTKWKQQLLREIKSGSSFLDLACGTGILTRMIAQKFLDSHVTGVDIMQGYIDVAKQNSTSFSNIFYVHQDAEKLDLERKFDCITSSYIPKYCDAEILVKACLKHLKPGGKIILHDFIYPNGTLVRWFWNAYFVVLPKIGNLVPNWKQTLIDLPKLIRETNWLVDYESVMKKYGMRTKVMFLTCNSAAIISATFDQK